MQLSDSLEKNHNHLLGLMDFQSQYLKDSKHNRKKIAVLSETMKGFDATHTNTSVSYSIMQKKNRIVQ